MRANYKLQRLYSGSTLNEGARVSLDKAQSNYLLNVLRLQNGSQLLLFNGKDGEWRTKLELLGKKTAQLVCEKLERPQTPPSTLLFCFAPLKVGRLDYMVQKAVEMGAGVLQPVLTDFTQNHRLNMDKMRSWTIEAAEQCGVLALAQCNEPVKLSVLLENWEEDRALIFCDEGHGTDNPLPPLENVTSETTAVLIGPEGGFSDTERTSLRAKSFVHPVALGPRILRADTAAVAALAIVQAKLGDWR
ncbi:MAG: 16S rRNA (uracil(1498)-N(3))-methyltransferase [Pseudomonadota bacterium]